VYFIETGLKCWICEILVDVKYEIMVDVMKLVAEPSAAGCTVMWQNFPLWHLRPALMSVPELDSPDVACL